MTEKHYNYKTIEELILEKLEEKGFCIRDIKHPIDMLGGENRFDGKIDGKARADDPAESFKVERQGDGSYKVIFHSFRSETTHSGAFVVGASFSKSPKKPRTARPKDLYTPLDMPVLEHPYAQKKGITKALPHMITRTRWLMGPCLSFLASCPVSKEVRSAQDVAGSGEKKNEPGTKEAPKPIAGYCWAAWPNKDGSTEASDFSWLEEPTLYVAEGAATAYSVWDATGKPCLACFGKGSFEKLTANLRYVYSGEIIWVLDTTSDEELANQLKNAEKYEAGVTYPILTQGSDFNDLYLASGLEAVVNQLQNNILMQPKACNNPLNYYKLSPEEAIRDLADLGFHTDYSNLWLIQGDPNRRGGEFVFSIEDGSILSSAPRKLKNILIFEGRTAVSKTSDQDLPNGHVAMVPGHGRILNYRPPEPELRDPLWKKAKVTDKAREKAALLYDFLCKIYPESIGQLMMLLKHLVYCPKYPLPFAVIIYGPRGTGKSCFLQLARLIIGPKNTSQGSTLTSMMGTHGADLYVNSFLNTLDEVDLDKVAHWGDAKLKQVITERKVDLNRKFKDIQRGVKVRCNFLWATNEILQAASFADDRRYVWVPSLTNPLSKSEYAPVANDILDTYGLQTEKEFDWAPIRAFVEMYINPITYDGGVINAKNTRLAHVSTSNPVKDIWGTVDKKPLDEGRFFDLRDIAKLANNSTEFYRSLFRDTFCEETSPSYAKFVTDLKETIVNEGKYVVKRSRLLGPNNSVHKCTGVMRHDTAGSPANLAEPQWDTSKI